MRKKFAFIFMGEHYTPEIHNASFETDKQITYVYTVKNYEEAKEKVLEITKNGVKAIELCGAFGKEKAEELIKLTNNEIFIGYVVSEDYQNDLAFNFFNK